MGFFYLNWLTVFSFPYSPMVLVFVWTSGHGIGGQGFKWYSGGNPVRTKFSSGQREMISCNGRYCTKMGRWDKFSLFIFIGGVQ
jgi:hypothetical protein